MSEDAINEEIEMCLRILDTFKEELVECKKEYDLLKKLEIIDKNNPDFIETFSKCKEKYNDINISVKLIINRVEKLREDLKEFN